MALQSSGAISIDDIRTELGITTGSLDTLSTTAGFSVPHSMSEFYGYSSVPPYSNTAAYQYDPGMYARSMYTSNYAPANIDVNNDFSVSFWYRMDNAQNMGFTSYHVGYIFCVSDNGGGFAGANNGFYVRKQGTSGVFVSFSGSTFSGNWVKSTNTFGQWNFVLLTYEASTKQLKIYLNGSTTPSTLNIATTQSPSTTNRYLTVGNQRLTYTNVWPGAIDDLAFYNTTLSSADSATLYNSGNPYDISQIPSAINWYKFENNIRSEYPVFDLLTNGSVAYTPSTY